MHPVASIRLWAGQSVLDECGLIKSEDYAPRLELLHHFVPIVARPHQVPSAPEMIRHLPVRKALDAGVPLSEQNDEAIRGVARNLRT